MKKLLFCLTFFFASSLYAQEKEINLSQIIKHELNEDELSTITEYIFQIEYYNKLVEIQENIKTQSCTDYLIIEEIEKIKYLIRKQSIFYLNEHSSNGEYIMAKVDSLYFKL